MVVRRRHALAASSVSSAQGFEDQIRLWSLRLIWYALQNDRHVSHRFQECLAQLLDLEEEDIDSLSRRDLKRLLKAAWQEQEARAMRWSGPLAVNLKRLRKTIGLTEEEAELLAFTVLMKSHALLKRYAEAVGEVTSGELPEVLSAALSMDGASLQKLLHRDGVLASAGLLEVDHQSDYNLPHKIDLLEGLDHALLTEQGDIAAMFARYFRPAQAAALTLAQYPHLQAPIALIRAYLADALKRRTPGVNVLLYGPPGTGKTQLARALGAVLKASLSEVAAEDEEGDGVTGKDRLRAFRLGQRILSRSPRQLLLFDEAEDVFPSEPAFFFEERAHRSGRYKGWINRQLETNPVPTVWISNQVDQIDPAFLRRYNCVLEVPVPPRSIRRAMLAEGLRGLLVSAPWLDRLAENEDLTPADIERARKVVTGVRPRGTAAVEAALTQVIRGRFKAQGLTLLTANGSAVTPYSPAYSRTSEGLDAIADGLLSRGHGRLCLYGPPGTGKTAFAHYLAEHLGRPLLVRRASDLLGPYVGQTEANIAKMFRRAADEGAVLLLDEADSFLRDRRGAHQSWEVTQVNELLKQMEEFEGVLVCATNLMDSVDEAVLRRFDLKVEYRYLASEQAWQLFCATLEQHSTAPDTADPSLRQRLARLHNLTPGDFATVLRRAGIMGRALDARTLIAGLEQECSAKPDGRKAPIGFV